MNERSERIIVTASAAHRRPRYETSRTVTIDEEARR